MGKNDEFKVVVWDCAECGETQYTRKTLDCRFPDLCDECWTARELEISEVVEEAEKWLEQQNL